MREGEAGVAGAREFLSGLPHHTLLTLCQTITHNDSQLSPEDAVSAIILHSHDLESILRRKAMTRDLLIQYLHRKGLSTPLSTVKQELVKQILTLWNNETTETVLQPSVQAPSKPQLQAMAKQFVEWFYPLLRDCALSDDNFWENSEVILNLSSCNGQCETSVFSGLVQILSGLVQLVRGYGVFLSPNYMGGYNAESDPHGLVLVSCSGIVYQGVSCVGVFRQEFALTSDPFSPGDWRIKRTKLDVRVDELNAKTAVQQAIENA